MRTTEAVQRLAHARGAEHDGLKASVVAWAIGTLLVLGLCVGVPAAAADRKHDEPAPPAPTVPSLGEVHQAQDAAQDAADRVAEIQAALAMANAELDAAAVRAEQAVEAYNGARWRADQAAAKLRSATADARRAERALERQRDRLAGFVAASYQGAGSLSALDAVLGATGPQGVMDQLVAAQGGSSSLDAQLQRFGASADLAKVFRAEAQRAREAKLQALEEAAATRDAATSAEAAAASVASSVAAQKTRLLDELARLQGISVRIAEQRQTALEEIARQRAAEEAAREAAQQAAEEAARRAAAEAARRKAQEQEQQETADEPDPEPQPAPAPNPAPAPAPPPATPTVTAPAPSGGAGAAIAFAKAQLGEPYVWGAAGPDAWDCSGLTMGAWQAAGVSLPHYSVAQYDATTPISAAQLRPGDLLFWGTTSSPSSIHHVALYLGDGMMIHAPRTGRPVEIDSMYYWIPPNFFGRV